MDSAFPSFLEFTLSSTIAFNGFFRLWDLLVSKIIDDNSHHPLGEKWYLMLNTFFRHGLLSTSAVLPCSSYELLLVYCASNGIYLQA